MLVVATNPLDEMLALCQAKSGLPHRRVIGEAGLLNIGRWKHVISERLGTTPDKVEGIVLGSHGETMVPVPSLTTVDGRPLTELLDDSDDPASSSRRLGRPPSEILAYLKSGSGYFAAAVAGEATVRAIVQRRRRVVPVCAWLTGEYGLSDLYFGVPAGARPRGRARGDRAPARPRPREACGASRRLHRRRTPERDRGGRQSSSIRATVPPGSRCERRLREAGEPEQRRRRGEHGEGAGHPHEELADLDVLGLACRSGCRSR